jgi:hypothetical protein
MIFPGDKRFAFSILDDTDDATVENVQPIYDLLDELSFRTTKSVWPLDCPEGSTLYFAGKTLEDDQYLKFVHSLLAKGFELNWHCATMESSCRARTEQGLRSFEDEFGFVPKIHCNHGQNRENIYWGPSRYQTILIRSAVQLYSRMKGLPEYSGEVGESPYFWGDLCHKYFRFVRNFTFIEINVLNRNPEMPYRLSQTPFVQYWFSTADAPNVECFNRLLTRENIDRLMREAGVCIVSTHLGKGFVKEGKVNQQTEDILRYLGSLPGWFVPVSEILEYLLHGRPERSLPFMSRLRLEFLHVIDRLRARAKII